MSTRKNRFIWTADKLNELKDLSQIMTARQLADWFGCSTANIRQRCKKQAFAYLLISGSGTTYPLNAQESIALFKQQYKNSTINQLLTKPWSKHEQITTNQSHC